MITLKIVTTKTETERLVGKWKIDNFGVFFVENKDLTKLDSFLF